jgi:hypothetical protein
MTTSPGTFVLQQLADRLRTHARGICNANARRTIGRDCVAAAEIIERLAAQLDPQEAADAAMVALMGSDGFAAYVGRRA